MKMEKACEEEEVDGEIRHINFCFLSRIRGYAE